MMGISVDGIANLDRRLKTLAVRVQKKLVRNALTAGMRIVAKAIKREVPSKWKAGRRAVGQSVKVDKYDKPGQLTGKAGVGVGMKRTKLQKLNAAAKARGRGHKKGVGLGVANFHWFVAGTEDRYTGTKKWITRVNRVKTVTLKRTGNATRFTGRMKKTPIVKRGYKASKSEAAKVIKANFLSGVEREVAKL